MSQTINQTINLFEPNQIFSNPILQSSYAWERKSTIGFHIAEFSGHPKHGMIVLFLIFDKYSEKQIALPIKLVWRLSE